VSIRFKLTMGFLAILLIGNSILSVVAVGYLSRVWLEEVQTRVRLDLNAAMAAYQGHIDQVAHYLEAASIDPRWAEGIASNNEAELARLVDAVRSHGGLDIVNLVGPDGRLLCRRQEGERGDDLAADPLVSACLAKRSMVGGAVVVPAGRLERESRELAERARLRLVPTAAARATADTERSDGLVIGAAVPLQKPEGGLQGVLLGGNLLSGRFDMVDAIRDQVFPGGGTVTVFLGDLRVSTNVLNEDGSRAVGTRMSEAVHEAVLERGEVWADRAFVVSDWYITAYEPIRDPAGGIVGALYVGLPEAPFAARKRTITAVVMAIVGGATLVSLILVVVVTQLVLRPVGRIIDMSHRVIAGDLNARVGIRPAGEMGVLCRAIDAMGEAVAERERQLKETTRQQISRSEQLAAIGRLAAGVAHEINNPLTAVLTFAHLLRDKSNMETQDRQDLELVIHETTRAAEIVRGLLDFARERPVQREALDINEVIRQTMRLVRSQKQAKQVKVIEDLAQDLPRLTGDRNQLQQVLVNLSLNACEAMPEGGTLTVRSRGEPGQLVIEVIDTGHGIKPEHVDMIFEPFFTTKAVGKGTGLGLSVSYGIVLQHRGTLEFDTEVGKGTTFRMTLPVTDAAGKQAAEEPSTHE